ncbi:MAG: diadenosine tetraphosphate hydrolase, partial [Candidatus Micrarchaeota archaeon]
TGISSVEIIRGFRERIEYHYQRGPQKVSKEVVFFLGHIASPEEVKVSNEHVGYEWLRPEDALGRLTFDTAKDLLRKSEKALESWGAAH